MLHVQKHSSQPFTELLPQGCSTNASRNYMWFDVTTTLRYSCLPFWVRFPSHLQPTLSQHTPRFHKPLTHPVDHPKRKIFSLVALFPSRNPPKTCLIANLRTILFLDSKFNIYLKYHHAHSNNPHAPHTTQNGQIIYHSQDWQGKDIWMQCLIAAHQSWMVKCSHRARSGI